MHQRLRQLASKLSQTGVKHSLILIWEEELRLRPVLSQKVAMRLPEHPSYLPLWVASALFLTGVCAFAAYGWVAHGSAIYLSLSQSLAAWCM
jgi:hypothetical protein